MPGIPIGPPPLAPIPPVSRAYLKVPADLLFDMVALLRLSTTHPTSLVQVHNLIERLGKESRNP